MAKVQLKDSQVKFDEANHTYELNGKYLSGITGMLSRQLFKDEYKGVNEEVLMAAAQYGTAVHKATELFDREWINDGSVEVQDYITLCKEHNLVHEASEYTVTDGKNWASNIDKIYREDDQTFTICDLKTYGIMTADKLEKARWQCSILGYLLEKQIPKAKVGRLLVMHLRNKFKSDGTTDRIKEVIEVKRIPSEICKELLDTDLRGEQFQNPFSIPEDLKQQEGIIRELMEKKAEIEERLGALKSEILEKMTNMDIRTWATDTMRITRKLPSTRSTFDLRKFQAEHVGIDYAPYFKTSNVAGSVVITI